MGNLNIVTGNILDYISTVDAIVNSNNEYMIAGSGVCGVIYKAAGKNELENYCKEKFKTKMLTNEIRITPGFNLNKDIINIFAPKYYEHIDPIKKLMESYEQIFSISKQKGYKTILSVSIGTGVHGYKHNEVGLNIIPLLYYLVEKFNINFTLVLSNEEIAKIYRNDRQ
ncbi:MAG: macro domain-containing protein [Bacilli bacterium]|nr:macro domain-containing protein [Bacilli bacterium]